MAFLLALDRDSEYAASAARGSLRLALFAHREAARRSQTGGVNQVSLFLNRHIEDSLDGCVTDQLSLPFRDVSAVADRDFFERTPTDLRQKRSQPLRQR